MAFFLMRAVELEKNKNSQLAVDSLNHVNHGDEVSLADEPAHSEWDK